MILPGRAGGRRAPPLAPLVLAAAAGCGGEARPVDLALAWAAVAEATSLPLTPSACALTPRRACPQGGFVERPGLGALLAARALGRAPARFVLAACDVGQQPVSGTLEATLTAAGDQVVAHDFDGLLRLHADGGRLCGLHLSHAPTEAAPWRHQGELCGQAGELPGPPGPAPAPPLRTAAASGISSPARRP